MYMIDYFTILENNQTNILPMTKTIPMHVVLKRLYPALHLHEYPPSVLLHICTDALQLFSTGFKHSSTSTKGEKIIISFT